MNVKKYIKKFGIYPLGKERRQYQSYILDGKVVPGFRNCQQRWKWMLLPNDFSNKNLLDIGCQIGAFCLEAKRREANKVVGVDANGSYIKCAKKLAFHEKLEIKYLKIRVNDHRKFVEAIKQINCFFNYILFLSVVRYVDGDSLSFILNSLQYEQVLWEGHASFFNKKDDLHKYVKKHKILFSDIEYIGKTTDKKERLLWRLIR